MIKVFYVLVVLSNSHHQGGISVDHYDTLAECDGAKKAVVNTFVEPPNSWGKFDLSAFVGAKCERVEVTIK